MYVEAFTNRNRFQERRVIDPNGDPPAYRPGDELELCYEAERPGLADLDPEDAAQTVYGHLNSADTEKLWPYHRAFSADSRHTRKIGPPLVTEMSFAERCPN